MGGEDDEPSPPKPSLVEKYRDWKDERAEQRAHVAAWMNGREPVQWWETFDSWRNDEYGMTVAQRVFCMEFPTTVHYLVVAYENYPEIGRLYTWCFGCKDHSCGACIWARKAYILEVKRVVRQGDARDDDLPF